MSEVRWWRWSAAGWARCATAPDATHADGRVAFDAAHPALPFEGISRTKQPRGTWLAICAHFDRHTSSLMAPGNGSGPPLAPKTEDMFRICGFDTDAMRREHGIVFTCSDK
jgi:hypothetical protein